MARGQFHREQQVVRHGPALGLDLDRCEVDCRQTVPVGLQELLPRRLPLAVRHRLDPMRLQDVPHGLIRDLAAKIRQRPLNPIITLRRIFPSHPQHELFDLVAHWRACPPSLDVLSNPTSPPRASDAIARAYPV